MERESDPNMSKTTGSFDTESGTFMQLESSSSASIFLSTPLHMWVGASVLAIPETMAKDNYVFGAREARGRQPWFCRLEILVSRRTRRQESERSMASIHGVARYRRQSTICQTSMSNTNHPKK